jgi:hypothetical protein
VRVLRRDLAHLAAELGTMDADAVGARDVSGLVGRLAEDDLPPDRVQSILDSVRALYAYAIERGLARTSPLAEPARAGRRAPTPTAAMLALGEEVVGWSVKLIVIAFVVVALGLVVALA